MNRDPSARLAILSALAAFIIWGLLPIYWKQLKHVDPFAVVCHRIVWSVCFLILVRIATKEFKRFLVESISWKDWLRCLPAALFIGTNWFVFIWAVQSNHVIDTSLGYFLTPLCNVLFAVLFLGERINRLQSLALIVAATGLAITCLDLTHFPWIAICLAVSFAIYSLVKKKTKLPTASALFYETAILFPAALYWLGWGSETKLSSLTTTDWLMLLAGGPITAIPLFMFSFAAPRTSMVNIGMLQYIAPSLQLLLGWLIYHEAMTTARWSGFVLVWCSLIIYTINLVRSRALVMNAGKN